MCRCDLGWQIAPLLHFKSGHHQSSPVYNKLCMSFSQTLVTAHVLIDRFQVTIARSTLVSTPFDVTGINNL